MEMGKYELSLEAENIYKIIKGDPGKIWTPSELAKIIYSGEDYAGRVRNGLKKLVGDRKIEQIRADKFRLAEPRAGQKNRVVAL